ncbi:DNA polymerase theta [Aplysia californica]|uniref:DNA-directed DNA polymerase n=1 Tax=Aplysia californica TaxID=6500 RepID=A0ABM1A7G9_APLCA|nr:DNA polymerase theta [Aplysia californica]
MQRLNHTWRQQKPLVHNVQSDEKDSALRTGIQHRNQGKRRLGRFAISSAPVIVKTANHKIPSPVGSSSNTHASAEPQQVVSENGEQGDIPPSFLSSFSASMDSDFLKAVEKMEAAMDDEVGANKIDDGSCLSTLNRTSPEDDLDNKRDTCTNKFIERTANKSVHPTVELKGGGKRKLLKDSTSSIYQNKMELLKHGEAKASFSPSCSPLDKKPRRRTRNPTTVSEKGNLCQSITHNTVAAHNLPASSGKTCGLDDSIDCSEISFSPLLSTPGNLSNISIDDTSPLETPKSRRNLSALSWKKLVIEEKHHKENSQAKKSSSRLNKSSKGSSTKATLKKRRSPSQIFSSDLAITKRDQKVLEVGQNSEEKSLLMKTGGEIKSAASQKPRKSPRSSGEISKLNKRVDLKLRNKSKIDGGKENFDHMAVLSESENVIRVGASVGGKSELLNTLSTLNSDFSHAREPGKQQNLGNEASPTSANASTSVRANASLTEDKRQLSSWGLPEPVLEAYRGQGVTVMFEWQAECLLTGNALEGGNLIYSAPTSAGKTLVAELLMLKRVVETKKKALIILPFVSVAREKMYSLQSLFQDAGIKVGGYMGSYSPAGGLSNVDIAVCTIEKGNGLINRLMGESKLNDLGAVVVDELHMVGDAHRGYLLELLLTKLAFVTRQTDEVSQGSHIQIIGMSATLPNLPLLAKWLNASLYHTDFRPIPLSEHIKVDNKILDSWLVVQREIPPALVFPDDADHVLSLCLETVLGNHGVLVFCPTKNWCEKLCEFVARNFYSLTHNVAGRPEADEQRKDGEPADGAKLTLDRAGLKETVEQLRRTPVGVDPMLGRCVLNGVAYHHAGLTFDERDIIEGAFRQGHLKVLIATSTLSSGVNLPARRVIIRTPIFHGAVLDILTYKQMSGRAGRKGVDVEGESVLICKPAEKLKGQKLLTSDLSPVVSCLHFDPEDGLSSRLKRAILEVVVSGVAASPEAVMDYVRCTLLSASMSTQETEDQSSALLESCVQFLQENEFVSVQVVEGADGPVQKFLPTQLGSAILASSLSPDEGLLVFAELQKARRCFVLDTELHIIYLVTPVYTTDVSTTLDWYHYYSLWESLTPADRRVAELVGVTESFIARAIRGRVGQKTESQRKALAVHRRFYTALILNSLIQETPLMEVAEKFSCSKGQLQSLQQSAATYAGMVTVFCGRLGWHHLELLLSRFQPRLSCGVQQELVDLVRVSALNATSARMLYNAGYHTVADLARAEDLDIEDTLKKAVPFQSEKRQDGETDWELQERRRARCIWLTGRKGVTELEAAQAIINEAKAIVQGDLGVKDIDWAQKVEDKDGVEMSDEDLSERNVDGLKENDGEDVTMDGESAGAREDQDSGVTSRDDKRVGKSFEDDSIEAPVLEHGGLKNGRVQCDVHVSTGRRELTQRDNQNPVDNEFRKTERSDCVQTRSPPVLLKEKEKFIGQDMMKDVVRESGRKQRQKHGSGGEGDVSPRLQVSHNLNMTRRTQRRRSDKRRSLERSFFGQVVVSPPPGVVTKTPPSSSGPTEPQNCQGRTFKESENRERKTRNLTDITVLETKAVEGNSVTGNRLASERDASIVLSDQNREQRGNISVDCDAENSFAINSSICNDESAFNDSFVLDTQTVELINRGCTAANTQKSQRTSNRGGGSSEPQEVLAKSMSSPSQMNDVNEKTNYLHDDLKKSSGNYNGVACDGKVNDLDTGDCITPCRQSHDNSDAVLSEPLFNSDERLSTQAHKVSTNPPEPFSSILCDIEQDDGVKKLVVDCGEESHRRSAGDDSTSGCSSLIAASNYERLEQFDEGLMDGSSLGEEDFGRSHFDQNLNLDEALTSSAGLDQTGVIEEDDAIEKTNNKDNAGIHGKTRVSPFTSDLQENEELLLAALGDSFSESLTAAGIDPGVSPVLGKLCSGLVTKDAGISVPTNSTPNIPERARRLVGKTLTQTQKRMRELTQKLTQEAPKLEDDKKPHFSGTSVMVNANKKQGILEKKECYATAGYYLAKGPGPIKSKGTFQSHGLEEGDSTRNGKLLSTNGSKTTQSSASHGNVPVNSDECFPDSFSSSLMDKLMRECETLPQSSCRDKSQNLRTNKIHLLGERPQGTEQSDVVAAASSKPSSNNSSRNDGSDCVPPTPPEETSSFASPLKMAANSPLRVKDSGRKMTSPFVKLMSKGKNGENSGQSAKKVDSAVVIQNQREKFTVLKDKKCKKSLQTGLIEKVAEVTGKVTDNHLLEGLEDNSSIGTRTLHKAISSVADYSGEGIEVMSDEEMTSLHGDEEEEEGMDGLGQSLVASQLLTQQSFTIMDVCADQRLFDSFLAEWRAQPCYSLAVACERKPSAKKGTRSASGIGSKFMKRKSSPSLTDSPSALGLLVPDTDSMLVGVAVTWGSRDAYFLSLMPTGFVADIDPDDTLAEPPLDETLTQEIRLQALAAVLQEHADSGQHTVGVFDAKSVYVLLARTLGSGLPSCEDPRVADWLRQPGGRLKNLHRMVTSYIPAELPLLDAVGGVTGLLSLSCDVRSGVGGRLRACTESVLTLKLMGYFQEMLAEEQLLEAFRTVEMPAVVTLARMELNGFGVSEEQFESQKSVMMSKLTFLEERAYQLAGHVFSLTSTDDIAKILYIELRLPLNGDPNAVARLPTRGRGKRTTVGSTSKEVLEKLSSHHQLPAVILEWRRLSSALTKSLLALQREAKPCARLDMPRVFSDCQIFSATGRVSIAEPNLQNIPKDFAISLPGLDGQEQNEPGDSKAVTEGLPVSMRKIFVPFRGAVIVAADYSQLELRIICHLSGDTRLASVLNTRDGDVFKIIASQMKSVNVDEVTPDQRAQAKQVCYGMLYGIGPKALGEQLGVDVNEASVFMETFKARYPGVRRYLRDTVTFCQKNGFVKTMFNRRRYLPSIKHSNPNVRAHAERQAVNTTIQGSAADLVKIAMTNIDKRLMELFPASRVAHSQATSHGVPVRTEALKGGGAYLVLQLHDELIYEVTTGHLMTVAGLIKHQMEKAITLNVQLPVKVRAGPSWAEVQDLDIV